MQVVIFAFVKNITRFGSINLETASFITSSRRCVGRHHTEFEDVHLTCFSPLNAKIHQSFCNVQTTPFWPDVYTENLSAVFCLGRFSLANACHADQAVGLFCKEDHPIFIKVQPTLPK